MFMTHKVTLVGNPNTGKTTLLNTLTASNEKASNWHGVTVENKTKRSIFCGDEFLITDIPGIYSLNPYSTEEEIAINYLKTHKQDLIVNVCDANNLKRNLALTIELINNGYKVLLVINMANEITPCNYNELSKELGVKILSIDARKKKTKQEIFNYIKNYALNYNTQITPKSIINHSEIIKNDKIFNKISPYKISDKVDNVILNKFLFLPLFFIVMFVIFYLTFGSFGGFVTEIINIFFNKIANCLYFCVNSLNITQFIKDFINNAIIGSCFSLLSFLPQIIMLVFFINLIEDIGVMSRFAFMFDSFLKRLGLTGKSIFSLFMGFGCSTSSIITTRNLENINLKKKTISLIPFIPCSAKLPIFLTIASIFFENHKYLYIFALYIFSLIILIFVAFIQNKKNKTHSTFLIEMPKYRLPNIAKITKDTSFAIKEFVLKIAKTILLFSVIVWILQNLSPQLIYLKDENFDKSILYLLSSKLTFLFKPLGLDNVGVVASLILGLCAKELIVVGLYMINGVDSLFGSLTESLTSVGSICYFSKTSAIVFLVFVLLYSPCISAIAATASEVNRKIALKMFLSQTLIAYIVALLVNICLSEFTSQFLIVYYFAIIIVIYLHISRLTNKCIYIHNLLIKITPQTL